MKKKVIVSLISAFTAFLLVFGILFIPIPKGTLEDGGTRDYVALTYRIVKWNRIQGYERYEKTRVYFGADRKKSISELWLMEMNNVEYSFIAVITEIYEGGVLVESVESEGAITKGEKITFGTSNLEKLDIKVGSVVRITYTGGIMESYPGQIFAKSWELADVSNAYTDFWLEKSDANKSDVNLFNDITITEIYSNCFFAEPVIPMPYKIKLNGVISDNWCVGDTVICTYDNVYFDSKTSRIEVDLISIEASDFELDPGVCYKPVIYLYPEEEMNVSVKLDIDGGLTCTYPKYTESWEVTAFPDGSLKDKNGKTYNYLYWEGKTSANFEIADGFCIKGEDTAVFLEHALEKLGLNRREANEFIVFWLPLMEQNPYNVISFNTEIYNKAAKLDIYPIPDTVIRVFMTWKSSDEYVELQTWELTAPERKGFTAVEWGGTQIK